MKILLINPPYPIYTGYDSRNFLLGLCYVGAAWEIMDMMRLVMMLIEREMIMES